MRKKLLSMLVLLMTAVTGAWAQEQSEPIETRAQIVEGIHFTISSGYGDGDGMCADEGGITVTPKNGETITKVVISCTRGSKLVNEGNTSVSSGTKEITNDGGTITVTGVNASTFTFTCSNGIPQFGQFVVYYTEAPAAVAVTAHEGATGEYWATYYNSTTSFTADDNTTIYKGVLNGSSLQLTEVADIASGQAVILKSSAATITLTPAATTTADFTGNDLKGGTSVTSGYDAYTLSRGADGTGTVGFYKFNGGALDGSKAHLEIAQSAGARSFIGFGDDNTTAIEAPTATIIVEDGEIYDLMGRRIEGQPTRKGIYVKNGQKFIVK